MDLLLGRSRLSVTHCQEGNKAAEGNTDDLSILESKGSHSLWWPNFLMQVSEVSSEQRAGLFTLLSRGAEVKISRYLRGNLLYVRGNAVQALTPGCTSRSMWIIRVFFFLILESTLSYVRQLEARVRQLEEENRMLPQVGDFCWWEQ